MANGTRDRCVRDFNTFLDANRDLQRCSYFVMGEKNARALDARLFINSVKRKRLKRTKKNSRRTTTKKIPGWFGIRGHIPRTFYFLRLFDSVSLVWKLTNENHVSTERFF